MNQPTRTQGVMINVIIASSTTGAHCVSSPAQALFSFPHSTVTRLALFVFFAIILLEMEPRDGMLNMTFTIELHSQSQANQQRSRKVKWLAITKGVHDTTGTKIQVSHYENSSLQGHFQSSKVSPFPNRFWPCTRPMSAWHWSPDEGQDDLMWSWVTWRHQNNNLVVATVAPWEGTALRGKDCTCMKATTPSLKLFMGLHQLQQSEGYKEQRRWRVTQFKEHLFSWSHWIHD